MNTFSKKFILPSLATLMLFNGSLFSENETQEAEVKIEGHVSVGERETDPSNKESLQNRRSKELEEEQATQQPSQTVLRKASLKLNQASSSQFMLAPREMTQAKYSLAAYAYPINCHWLTSVSDNGGSIELEDGSHWHISPMDSYVLRGWRRDDSLVITPNYSWFSNYDYFITNKSNNTYIKANLYIGPVAYGAYSHWIVNIDYYSGHIFLENQMIWCVDPLDVNVIKNWAINDHIILGINDSWFSHYDHLLINVNMDNHVRVKQY